MMFGSLVSKIQDVWAHYTTPASFRNAVTSQLEASAGQEWFSSNTKVIPFFEQKLGTAQRFGTVDQLFIAVGAMAERPTTITNIDGFVWEGSRSAWWATGREQVTKHLQSIKGGTVLLYRIF